MKTCTKCQKTEEQVKFSVRLYKSGTIGKHVYCQECNREYKKQHYLDNKESYVSKNKKRIKDNYQKLYSFLSDKSCKECGNKDPRVFEFNHLDPKIKKQILLR